MYRFAWRNRKQEPHSQRIINYNGNIIIKWTEIEH